MASMDPPPSVSPAVARPAPSSARLPSAAARRRAAARAGAKQRATSTQSQSPSVFLQQVQAEVERNRSRSRTSSARKSTEQPAVPSSLHLQQRMAAVEAAAARVPQPAVVAPDNTLLSAVFNQLASYFGGAAAASQARVAQPVPQSARQIPRAASPKPLSQNGHEQSSSRAHPHPHPRAVGSTVYDSSEDEEGSLSGNETDLEADDYGQTQLQQPSPTAAQLPTRAEGQQALFGTSNESSLSMSEDEPLSQMAPSHPRSSPRALSASPSGLSPCSFAAFGCESLVRSSADPHYAASSEHHLSLLQARVSVLSSQKTQLAQQVEACQQRETHLLDKQQRMRQRVAKRDDAIQSLRQRVRRYKGAHRAAQSLQLHNVQELVASFLGDGVGVPINARALLLQQQKEIARLAGELAQRNQLLQQTAHLLGSTAMAQGVGVAPPTVEAAAPQPQPQQRRAPKKQPKEQPQVVLVPTPEVISMPPVELAADATDTATAESVAAEGALASAVAVAPADVPFLSRSTVALAAQAPVSPAFKPLPQYVKLVPAQPLQSGKAAAPRVKSAAQALPARSPVEEVAHHYTVPHSSLKPLTQLMTKASLNNVLGWTAAAQRAAQQQPERPHYKPDLTARRQRERENAARAEAYLISLLSNEQPGARGPAQQQAPPAQSLFAQAKLHSFCPNTWVRMAKPEGK